jgi:hypothetical protein
MDREVIEVINRREQLLLQARAVARRAAERARALMHKHGLPARHDKPGTAEAEHGRVRPRAGPLPP